MGARGEVWAGYREKADGTWYDDPARCPAAPIFRLGVYLVNDLVGLFGPAAEVQVLQSRLFTGRPTSDNAQLAIRFRSGALATVYASFCIDDSQAYRNSLTLNFERGTIYRNVGPQEGKGSRRVELTLAAGNGERPRVARKAVPRGSGDYDWATFHRAIRRREALPPSVARQAVDGLRILHALERAVKRGGGVSV